MNKYHYILILLFLYLFVKGRIVNTIFKKDFLYFFFWGLTYWIFINSAHLWSELLVPTWILSFVIGYSLCKDKKTFFDVLLIMALGHALEGFFTVKYSSGMEYLLNYVGNTTVDRRVDGFWGGTRSFSALNVSYYLFSALLIYILYNKNIPIVIKCLAIVFQISYVYVAMRIAMRSSLILCPLIILISYIVLQINNKFNIKYLLYFVFTLFLFGGILYYSGLLNQLSDSYLFHRLITLEDGGIENNSRLSLQSSFFEMYSMDFWGGLHSKLGYFFHNTWLDMYAFSGVFSFLFFIGVSICWLKNTIYVYRRVCVMEKTIVIGVFSAFFLPLYMDPMIIASPVFMAFFCLYCGMLSRIRVLIRSGCFI